MAKLDIIHTDRLVIKKITLHDSEFIFKLMNDEDWIKNIGDRGIKTDKDAKNYILDKFIKSYKELGFGFYICQAKSNGRYIGIVGLVNRTGLDHIDIGYALLPEHRNIGYAFEATKAMYNYGINTLKLDKIVAVVNSNNERSILLLEKLGMSFEKMVLLPDHTEMIKLYS